MTEEPGFWWALAALGIALFVLLYAAAMGDPDAPVELPNSSMDL